MHQSETEPGVAAIAAGSAPRPIDDPRVYLAAERTFLAWVRTSVALMGFGFLIARFALLIREYDLAGSKTIHARPQISTWLGFGMVCVGVVVCVMAAARHREYVGALRQGVANPPLNVNDLDDPGGNPGAGRSGHRHPHPHALIEREHAMQLGMIGLGRMGSNMVRRLMQHGQECVVYDVHAEAAAPLVEEGAVGAAQPRRVRRQAQAAAGDLADGPGGGRRRDDRAARRPAREGRHPDRRRQLVLSRRHPPRRGAQAEGDSLRGRGHQRRRLGPRARLLPDDRRRARGRAASRPDLRRAGSRHRDRPAHAGPREGRRHGRAGLSPLRTQRRGPLRQDGPQRHRVRPDGRVCRGAQHPQARQRRQANPGRRRRDDAAAQSRALPVRPEPRRHRRGLAARQRDRLLAARPDGAGPVEEPASSPSSRAGSPTRAKGAGRSSGDRRGRAGPRARARRCSRGSARAATTTTPTSSSRRCGSPSAATWRRRPETWESVTMPNITDAIRRPGLLRGDRRPGLQEDLPGAPVPDPARASRRADRRRRQVGLGPGAAPGAGARQPGEARRRRRGRLRQADQAAPLRRRRLQRSRDVRPAARGAGRRGPACCTTWRSRPACSAPSRSIWPNPAAPRTPASSSRSRSAAT